MRQVRCLSWLKVYSMDGDMAELAAVGRLCEEHGAIDC